jgi:hypothetical protein
MNQYIIQQKINTVSELILLENGKHVSMVIDGIEFKQWDFDMANGCRGNAWIAEGKEEAENYHEAVISFRKKLRKTVPKIAFISQCYMDYGQGCFLVNKTNNNHSKIAFFYYPHSKGLPGLMFMEEEKDNFLKLNLENNEFYWYMNDCYNVTGYTAKLLLIFAALESLAGKEIKVDEDGKEYETYNKENMKAILGDDLFNEIYGPGGLRHKLTHGEYINAYFSGKNYVETLHNLILEYCNKEFGATLNTGIVNPQRHPYGSGYLIFAFIQPKDDSIEIDIKNVSDDFDSSDAVGNQSTAKFNLVFNGTENY